MKHLYLLIVIVLSGCASVKIEGTERDSASILLDSTSNTYLVGDNRDVILRLFKFKGSVNDISQSATLELTYLDKNIIEVKLDNAGELKSKRLKGKFIDKEFKIKHQSQLRLLPPILWSFREDAYSLLKDGQGRLLIYNNSGGTVFLTLLPIGGTSTGQNKYTFNSVK